MLSLNSFPVVSIGRKIHATAATTAADAYIAIENETEDFNRT